jgi:putative inorganic carbon (HCO3(-)) transporter
MHPARSRNAALWLSGAAAVLPVVSIAGFETLLGAALVALVVTLHTTRQPWRWPPIMLPLCVWVGLTLLSAAASGDARAAFPQVKKFYVYLMLLVVVAAFRTVNEVRWVVLGWALGGSLSALWSFVQFARKYQAARAAHEDFYGAYIGARITGFMGHWMTFSGEMMMALLLIAAVVFFSHDRRWIGWLVGAGALIAAALIASETRSMWGGAFAGAVYLVWFWRRWLVLALPVLIAILMLANPFEVRERIVSVFVPHADMDSNGFRAVMRRTGWEMIKAHPWLGLGPEEVGPHFEQYVPGDVPRPLPNGYYGHLHNIYYHYAAERGVPAMLALMWMLGQALVDFIRTLRRLPEKAEQRWVVHGAIAVMIAVLLGGYFEVNLGDSEVLGMFLAVVGCGYVAVLSAKPASDRP